MENFEEENELQSLKDDLLVELFKDVEMPLNKELTNSQKDNFLQVLIVTRADEPASEKLLLLQNKFLKLLNDENKIDLNKLSFKHNVYFVDNDILNYEVDMLVVASYNVVEDVDSLMSGKYSLDNELLFRAGIELKSEILKNVNGNHNLILTKGYNLNAKYLAKIILPNNNSIRDKENLIFVKQDSSSNKFNFYNAKNNDTNFNQFFIENLKTIFEFAKEKELNSVAIDFSSIMNFDNLENSSFYKENDTILKNLLKIIEKLNKKQKIKVIFKK